MGQRTTGGAPTGVRVPVSGKTYESDPASRTCQVRCKAEMRIPREAIWSVCTPGLFSFLPKFKLGTHKLLPGSEELKLEFPCEPLPYLLSSLIKARTGVLQQKRWSCRECASSCDLCHCLGSEALYRSLASSMLIRSES